MNIGFDIRHNFEFKFTFRFCELPLTFELPPALAGGAFNNYF